MDLASVDHLLTTTRSVRRRLDLKRPVDLGVVERCIEIAYQAPTGSNAQGWHMLVVTDADKRAALAKMYKQAFTMYRGMAESAPQVQEGDPRRDQTLRIIGSAEYLTEHLQDVPVHVIPCIEGRMESAPVIMQASVYGSILPAVWSLMLALRSCGLGSADDTPPDLRKGSRRRCSVCPTPSPRSPFCRLRIHRHGLQARQTPAGESRFIGTRGDNGGDSVRPSR
jgi:nitroreductase